MLSEDNKPTIEKVKPSILNFNKLAGEITMQRLAEEKLIHILAHDLRISNYDAACDNEEDYKFIKLQLGLILNEDPKSSERRFKEFFMT